MTTDLADRFARIAPYEVGGSGATFSTCRWYRYRLWRGWGDPDRRLAVIGLNPSTADESDDDPTIRKCRGFAQRMGLGALDMLNLFAWRSTDPIGLLDAADPVGPENDDAIHKTCVGAVVLCAWGSHRKSGTVARLVATRAMAVRFVIAKAKPRRVIVLKWNADANPKHPLYARYDSELIEWPNAGIDLGGAP